MSFSVLRNIYCVYSNVVLFPILKYKQLSHIWHLSKKSRHEHSYEHPVFFHSDLHVFIITIFRSFSTFTVKFQVFLQKTYWCPLRSAAQLEFLTPWFYTFFILNSRSLHSEHHVRFLCQEIVMKNWYEMSLSQTFLWIICRSIANIQWIYFDYYSLCSRLKKHVAILFLFQIFACLCSLVFFNKTTK